MVLSALVVYALCLRPRILRWGASDAELAEEFPGAELFREPRRSATMATTIAAPAAEVWAWLVQMGTDRAGWYSWDRLDNWGRSSAERIHPEWQSIAVGDRLAGTPDYSQSWVVAVLEPERFLGLRMSLDLRGRAFDPAAEEWPSHYTDSLWGFKLEPLPDERTRLVVSGYWDLRPGWLAAFVSPLVLEPSHWIMQVRQFQNLRRRAERRPASLNRAG